MKTKTQKISAAIAGCALALSSVFAFSPATAAPAVESSSDYKEIVEHLKTDGVPTEHQDALAKKALSGVPLDSADPENEPVSVDTWNDGVNKYERKTYADNSYTLSTLEMGRKVPAGVAVPAAISGCIVTTGTGYQQNQNCRVSESTATYKASFTATYVFSGGVYGSISKASNGNVKGFGGTVSSISTKIEKSRSDGRVPASAYVKWNFKMAGDISGGTTYLYLKVTPKTAYTVAD